MPRDLWIGRQTSKGAFTPTTDQQENQAAINAGALLVVGGIAGSGKNASRLPILVGFSAPELPDLSPLALHIGLQLIGKGGTFNDGVGKTKSSLAYLELPVQVVYQHYLPSGKGMAFGGFGPYLGLGLWGKIKYTDSRSSESYPAFDKLAGYKRFDSGLTFVGGYQLQKGLMVFFNCELGLSNIETTNIEKTYNRVWSLNVAYPLKKLTDKLRKK
ncbi:MAG: PorT family protein [Rudanella sp.]|nr:PorT family protein [Rudanella sp.]